MSLIDALHAERLRLEKELRVVTTAIQGLGGKSVKASAKAKRVLSPEGRRRIQAAARKMWKAKRAKAATKPT